MTAPCFVLDRTRFPMIWSDSLQGYVHLLPITKIQLECFLADTYDESYGAAFYEELLQANGRVSPGQIRKENYLQALATGLRIRDVENFAAWCSAERDQPYEILEEGEWFALYDEFKVKAPWTMEAVVACHPSARAAATLRALGSVVSRLKVNGLPIDQADACLLRGGAFEWVRRGDDFRVAGQPIDRYSQGIIHLEGKGREARAAGNLSVRNPVFGARLLRRTA
jgi:hypothetical protein